MQAQGVSDFGKEDKDELKFRFPPGLGGLSSDDLPTQGRSVVEGTRSTAVAERDPSGSDQDYLSVRTTTPTTPQGCGHPRTRACILGGPLYRMLRAPPAKKSCKGFFGGARRS